MVTAVDRAPGQPELTRGAPVQDRFCLLSPGRRGWPRRYWRRGCLRRCWRRRAGRSRLACSARPDQLKWVQRNHGKNDLLGFRNANIRWSRSSCNYHNFSNVSINDFDYTCGLSVVWITSFGPGLPIAMYLSGEYPNKSNSSWYLHILREQD